MWIAEEVKDKVSYYKKALCKDSTHISISFAFEELSSCNTCSEHYYILSNCLIMSLYKYAYVHTLKF